ncbi:PREDICTED: ubiquitin carboxyl-terminal hydrolase 31-like [Priapulus caudatus]|uniref:ubiquitinyl hydrolase 1 n=1 Tax=Priapulus caudatus TaxID=37621 RepID=A0ABM1EWR1_PRICU|nr:PREDICTED: ubiquitin carboxyl-terminal hydrolase 31-like [Priapulus caudatus]
MESNDKKSMARSASESEIQRGRSGKTGGDRHRGRSRSPTPSLTSQRTSQQTKSATLPRTSTSKHSKTDERKASSNMKSKFFSPFLRVRERVRPLECFIQKVVRQVVNRTPIGRKRAEQRTRPAYRRNSFSSPSGPTHKLSKDKMPGSTGLRNLGNTCYINAIIQCLSKTDILAEYFCCDQYKADLARNNKINARTYGTRGELTENLALLFKSLWVCEYMPEVSSQFKSCVSKYGPQYRGSSQHDAQEFLVWLLDKVHEDLNIASKKKYRSNKSSYGRPDDIVAAEALANHTRCNSSFVQDLFLAQYQSSLTCPKCKRQSNNFDPFLCVSLPLPQRADRPVYVTIVYLDAQPKQVKLGVNVNINATVKELRSELSLQTKIPPKQFLMTELYYDGFYRTFLDDQSLSIVHETDNIYCIEVPPASDKLLIIASNRLGVGSKGRKFGSPLVLQLSRQASYQKLQDAILAKLAPCLKDGVTSKRMGVLFNIRVVDGIAGKSYLSHDDDHPLFVETVDRALEACAGNAPHHIKVILEWDPDTKQVVFSNVEDVIEEHASVQQLKGRYQKQLSATLSECFDLYTEEEKLDDKNTWLCPNCKRLPHGTTKRLSLWTLPDILVIHLKRFKQV